MGEGEGRAELVGEGGGMGKEKGEGEARLVGGGEGVGKEKGEKDLSGSSLLLLTHQHLHSPTGLVIFSPPTPSLACPCGC